jgi:hypothetical protein
VNWQERAPRESEAGERSWAVVRAAFDARISSPPKRDRRPLVAVAIAAAIVAAALTPAGQAVWGSLQDAVHNEDHLLSLPSGGRVLVNSPAGAWVVERDGSKRLLSGYADAAWSPHGLYLAAARGNQLVALEPNGRVHWKIAQARPVGAPQWSYEGFRIAYYAGPSIRIINGDGTRDRRLVANAVGTGVPALAWRAGTHELAYKSSKNVLVLQDVDSGRVLWRRATSGIEALVWSDDGQRLLVASDRPLVFDASGHTVAELPNANALPAAFTPRGHALALVIRGKGQSTVAVYSGPRYGRRRVVFTAARTFDGLAWSPNGRWLLIDWRGADQWVFLRSAPGRRIAVRNIGNTFDSGPEQQARLAGWCCP